MSDSDLVGGIYPKPPSDKAPDFIIGKLAINVDQFRKWMGEYLAANDGAEWVNIDMKVSKAGKGYAVLDTWKPEPTPEQPPAGDYPDNDDIPF